MREGGRVGAGCDVVEAVERVIAADDDEDDDVDEDDSADASAAAAADDDDDEVSALGKAVNRLNSATGRVNAKISGLFLGPTNATWTKGMLG